MNNVVFVKEVQMRPCLYDNNDRSYGLKHETYKAWDEIGKKMGLSGAACKEKWTNLRIAFQRHLKQYANGKQPKPYYLQEHMRFLMPFLKGLNIPALHGICNISDDEADTNEPLEEEHLGEEQIQREIKIIVCKTEYDPDLEVNDKREYEMPVMAKDERLPPTKRKKLDDEEMEKYMTDFLKRKSLEISPTDPVRSFLDSLDPELREMNTQQFKSFKRKVLLLIDNIMDDKSTTKDD